MSMSVSEALSRLAKLVVDHGRGLDDATAWDTLRANIEREADGANEPPLGLLVSMAMRVNHGFAGDDALTQEIQLRDMRRIWEEVSGRGFYHPDKDDAYKSHIKAALIAALEGK